MLENSRITFAIATLLLVLAFAPAHATCPSYTTLTANTIQRTSADGSNSSHLYRVYASDTGFITLDVSTALDDLDLLVDFLGANCDGSTPVHFSTVHQTGSWVVVEVDQSGYYYFEVAVPNPSQDTLPAYELRNAFNDAADGTPSSGTFESDPPVSCSGSPSLPGQPMATDDVATFTEDIDEWDRDVVSGGGTAGIMVFSTTTGDLRVWLYSGGSCTNPFLVESGAVLANSTVLEAAVHEGDFNLALEAADSYSGSYSARLELVSPCSLFEEDDHADSFLCATAIAVDDSDTGSISNTADDDDDLFTFTLDATTTVRAKAETTGSWIVLGGLYDEDGQRLEADDEDSADDTFEVVKTLAAGRYFVRVAGDGEGSYTLTLTALLAP